MAMLFTSKFNKLSVIFKSSIFSSFTKSNISVNVD